MSCKPPNSIDLPIHLLMDKTDPIQEQIRALAEEVHALRRDLFPTSSTILTGRDVVAEFQRLTGAR